MNQYLPSVDHNNLTDLFSDPYFYVSCCEYQDLLSSGSLDPDWRIMRNIVDTKRKRQSDPFKLKNYERYWGEAISSTKIKVDRRKRVKPLQTLFAASIRLARKLSKKEKKLQEEREAAEGALQENKKNDESDSSSDSDTSTESEDEIIIKPKRGRPIKKPIDLDPICATVKQATKQSIKERMLEKLRGKIKTAIKEGMTEEMKEE